MSVGKGTSAPHSLSHSHSSHSAHALLLDQTLVLNLPNSGAQEGSRNLKTGRKAITMGNTISDTNLKAGILTNVVTQYSRAESELLPLLVSRNSDEPQVSN